jgi:hypothetical protein
MSTALSVVRNKIHAVEMALDDSLTDTPLISRGAKAAGIQQAHSAIVDCLKAIAEALQEIERRTTDKQLQR